MNTLEITNEFRVKVNGRELCLVFYQYAVGTVTVRKTGWYSRMQGTWFSTYAHPIRYEGDPFKNSDPAEAERVFAEVEEWEKLNDGRGWWTMGGWAV